MLSAHIYHQWQYSNKLRPSFFQRHDFKTKNPKPNRTAIFQLRINSLNLRIGQQLLILGASGSGKTTLLSILTGLLPPLKGQVSYHGVDIFSLPSIKRDEFRAKNIGVVFQTLHLIPHLSAWDNILLAKSFLTTKDQANNADSNLAKKLLQDLDLQHVAHKSANNLSLGEQQRVAIARAMINQPQFLFLDEPSSALDDTNTKRLMQLLQTESKKRQLALIIATHDIRLKKLLRRAKTLSL